MLTYQKPRNLVSSKMTSINNTAMHVAPLSTPPARKLVSVRRISKSSAFGAGPAPSHTSTGGKLSLGPGSTRTDRFWELFADPSRENDIFTFRGREGYRVRSTRVFGHLSQGLVFPLAYFPEINRPYQDQITAVGYEAATDDLLSRSFAETLGVVKWEFTERVESLPNIGRPPVFIRPTGWPRIQDVEKSVFAFDQRKKLWFITEKLNGVTMTVYKIAKNSTWAQSLPELPDGCPPTMQDDSNRYGVCSRTEDLIDRDDNLYWQTAKASGVLRVLPHIDNLPNIAVIGELCGSSIEGNTMNYPKGKHEFVVFAIWDIDQAKYLPPKKTLEICKRHGLRHMPVIGVMTVGELAMDTGELLRKAEEVNDVLATIEDILDDLEMAAKLMESVEAEFATSGSSSSSEGHGDVPSIQRLAIERCRRVYEEISALVASTRGLERRNEGKPREEGRKEHVPGFK
ncbi:hypothetical protein VTJ49DRAFT_6057 [Mycothermus thermophilus]|uniref:RNA ligase domain-containing protein n=1 Tax=Humicola insolens TaxID=85995 RepID=A0ABR3VJX0_HUMIN